MSLDFDSIILSKVLSEDDESYLQSLIDHGFENSSDVYGPFFIKIYEASRVPLFDKDYSLQLKHSNYIVIHKTLTIFSKIIDRLDEIKTKYKINI
jgi:hypothetical protein